MRSPKEGEGAADTDSGSEFDYAVFDKLATSSRPLPVVEVESDGDEWEKAPELGAQDSFAADVENDATLRVEFTNKWEGGRLRSAVWCWTVVALGLTVAIFTLKFVLSADSTFFSPSPNAWWITNVSVAAAALACLLWGATTFAVRHAQVWRQGKQWSSRRRLFTADAGVMLLLQTVNTTFWLAPCALAAAHSGAWFSPAVTASSYVRWTCYNLSFVWMLGMAHACCQYRGPVRNPNPNKQLVMDVPFRRALWLHAPKALLWILLQLAITARLVLRLRNPVAYPPPPGQAVDCSPGTGEVAVVAVKFVLLVAYAALYVWYLRRAFRDHRALPLCRYRLTNMYIRIQARHGETALALVVLSTVALQLVLPRSCWSYVDDQFGMAPAQLAMVALALVDAYLMTPKGDFSHSIMQAWLQEFSWTEMGVASAMVAREAHVARTLSDDSRLDPTATTFARVLSLAWNQVSAAGAKERKAKTSDELRGQPMFCFELAAKCWYWSQLAYLWQDEHRPMSEAHALALFRLDHFEEVWDKAIDTRAVLGWADGIVVLAFRGTASMQNVITDIKLWLTTHEPARARGATPVKVHAGFYQAWTGGGYSERLLARLSQIVAGFSTKTGVQFYVTGHSLGGALATLAAHAIAPRFANATLRVYTYGAPRLGNSAWKAEYHQRVPDTWGIVNDQDPVPRVPAHAKRTGHRVVVNGQGDIVVRPSFFEHSILSRSGGSAAQHKMGQYALAFSAVMKAQFNPSKCMPRGAEGVVGLCDYVDVNETLLLVNSDLESLRSPDAAASPANLATPRSTTPRTPGKRRSVLHFLSCADLCLDAPPVLVTVGEEEEEEEEEGGGGGGGAEAGGAPDSTTVLQRHISFASEPGGDAALDWAR